MNYYDLLSIAKYEKIEERQCLDTKCFRIKYRWTLRLKYGFDLVYEVEESKEDQTTKYQVTNIEILIYVVKDGQKIERGSDIDDYLSVIDRIALRNITPDLDIHCRYSLSSLHRKLDMFNENQKQQDPDENQKFFEMLMQTEQFRELRPLTEQCLVVNGKLYLYPDRPPVEDGQIEDRPIEDDSMCICE